MPQKRGIWLFAFSALQNLTGKEPSENARQVEGNLMYYLAALRHGIGHRVASVPVCPFHVAPNVADNPSNLGVGMQSEGSHDDPSCYRVFFLSMLHRPTLVWLLVHFVRVASRTRLRRSTT